MHKKGSGLLLVLLMLSMMSLVMVTALRSTILGQELSIQKIKSLQQYYALQGLLELGTAKGVQILNQNYATEVEINFHEHFDAWPTGAHVRTKADLYIKSIEAESSERALKITAEISISPDARHAESIELVI